MPDVVHLFWEGAKPFQMLTSKVDLFIEKVKINATKTIKYVLKWSRKSYLTHFSNVLLLWEFHM